VLRNKAVADERSKVVQIVAMMIAGIHSLLPGRLQAPLATTVHGV
jgi:hypothetical protein